MESSDMDVEQLRKEIEKKPDNAMVHYYLGKKLFSQPFERIESIEEIKKELSTAIKLSPKLFMAHFYLGRLYFIMKQHDEAEKEFRAVLNIRADSILAREYLSRCLSVEEASIKTGHKSKSKSVRDVFFIFENEVRKFIESRLKSQYGDEWLRDGIPPKIRGECAKRREEGLEDERDLLLLHFADFHDYREIIEKNKPLFASYFDIKEWQKRLADLEPIRNALAHSRPVPEDAEMKIKGYYEEFSKVLKKV